MPVINKDLVWYKQCTVNHLDLDIKIHPGGKEIDGKRNGLLSRGLADDFFAFMLDSPCATKY